MTGVRKRACEPKPPWLRLMVPPGNMSRLEADICGGCSHWILRCKQGVWESWDPGVITGDDLTVAIILGRRLTRLEPVYGSTAPRLIDVCGERGIRPDAQYLAEHRCGLMPVSRRPYRPRKTSRTSKPWDAGVTVSDADIREFERIWNTPLRRTQ